MNYRIIYTLSNINLDDSDLKENNIKKIISKDDIDTLFTRDVLHVLSENEFETIKDQKYMYAFIIEEPLNIINKISNILSFITKVLSDSIICLDSGSMKYMNCLEMNYYAKNKFLIDKLFTVEIRASEYHTVYQTKGLTSLGINEIKLNTNKYHDVKTYDKFKSYISNSIANGKFDLFMLYGPINTIDEEQLMEHKISLNKKLQSNKLQHLKDNYYLFVELYNKYQDDKRFHFKINGKNISENIALEYDEFITDFEIVTDEIMYNEINIFYANKYKK